MRNFLIGCVVIGSMFVFSNRFETKPSTKLDFAKVQSSSVLICNSSSARAFHSYVCYGLDNCKAEIYRVSLSDAQSSGLLACKICYK